MSSDDDTPLHDAAQRGDVEALVSLLEKKEYDVDVRVRTEDQRDVS